MEKLYGQMIGVAVVEQHPCALPGLDHHRQVERFGGEEGVQLDVRLGASQLHGGKILAPLEKKVKSHV